MCVEERLRQAAHTNLTFNAPLSEERAAALVRTLPLAPGGHVLDLCCGWAELLLRVVEAHHASTGTGVDSDRLQLARAADALVRRRLHARVELVTADAATFADRGDVAICVGGAHAFGGTVGALTALADRLERGGTLLFGDGFWEREPGAAARELFGDLFDWPGLLAASHAAGYVIDAADRSTLEEWDAFERAWVTSDEPLRAASEQRAEEYRTVYRGVLGFAWLVLRRT